MSVLRNALDLPDEPPRPWRGPALALGAAAVVAALGVIAARTLALGGTTRPFLAVGVVTAIPALIVGWLLAGPHDRRTAIAAGAMALGIVGIPIGVAGATPSVARLTQIADGIDLPGKVVTSRSLGNSRCRDACSELRRTSTITDISFAKARARVIAALRNDGFSLREYPHAADAPIRIDATKGKVFVSVELRFVDLDQTRLATVFLADGPAPDHSVG